MIAALRQSPNIPIPQAVITKLSFSGRFHRGLFAGMAWESDLSSVCSVL